MAHAMIDELRSRKDEKVAPFVTMQRATGLILGIAPTFLITFRNAPWWVCFGLTALGGLVGLLATVEVGGMVLHERLLWHARGQLAARLRPDRLTPADLAGTRVAARRDAAIPLGGRVRVVRARPSVAIQRPGARQVPLARPIPMHGQEDGDAATPAEELSD